MVETTIYRTPTDIEKKEFREIGTRDFRDKFAADLAKLQLECTRDYKPICIRCAKLDFKDKVDKMFKEAERTEGISITDERLSKIFPFNFEPYMKEDRFELVNEGEVRATKVVDGVKVPFINGYNIDYRCKIRGCGITIFVPKPIYDEMKEKSVRKEEIKKEIKKEKKE